MDKEIKARWVAALRSGTYKQGNIYLNNNNETFCCLGVLCEVQGIPKRPSDINDGVIAYMMADGEPRRCTPTATSSGIDGMTLIKLCNMNDFENQSFAQIADWIEENL